MSPLVRALWLALSCLLAACEREQPQLNVSFEGQATRPTLAISASGVRRTRWLTLWYKNASGTAEVLWDVNLTGIPSRIRYGEKGGVGQYFPRDGARANDLPADAPIFLDLAYVFDGGYSMEAGLVQMGFVIDEERIRKLGQREYEAAFVPISLPYAQERIHGTTK